MRNPKANELIPDLLLIIAVSMLFGWAVAGFIH